MDIEITRNKYGSLFAVVNGFALFQFEYRSKNMGGPAWYFWLRGSYSPDIKAGRKADFPMDYFISAVRAKAFIELGYELTDEVSIVKGENYLRK